MQWMDFVYAAGAIIGLGGVFGAFIAAFRNGKATNLVILQQQNITALETRLGQIERDIARWETRWETLSALLLKLNGQTVTVDGDMVTLSDRRGHASSLKPRQRPAAQRRKTTLAHAEKAEKEEDA